MKIFVLIFTSDVSLLYLSSVQSFGRCGGYCYTLFIKLIWKFSCCVFWDSIGITLSLSGRISLRNHWPGAFLCFLEVLFLSGLFAITLLLFQFVLHNYHHDCHFFESLLTIKHHHMYEWNHTIRIVQLASFTHCYVFQYSYSFSWL